MEHSRAGADGLDKIRRVVKLSESNTPVEGVEDRRKKLRNKLDEVKEKEYQDFLDRLSSGGDLLNIPSAIEDMVSSPEVARAALDGISNSVSSGKFWIAEKIQEKITLEEKDLQEALENGFAKYLRRQTEFSDYGNLGPGDRYMRSAKKVFDVIESIKIPKDRLEDIILKEIVNRFKGRRVSDVGTLIKVFNIPSEKLMSSEIQSDVIGFTVDTIRYNRFYYLETLEKLIPGVKEVMHTSEVIEAATNLMISKLANGEVHDFNKIVEKFPELSNTFNESDVRKAALNGISSGFSQRGKYSESDVARNFIGKAMEIINTLSLTQEELSDPRIITAARDVALECLKVGWLDNYDNIKTIIPIPEKNFDSEEFILAVRDLIKNRVLSTYHGEKLENIFEHFPNERIILESDEIKNEIVNELVSGLDSGYNIEQMLLLKSRIIEPIPPDGKEKIERAAKRKFLECLRVGDIDMALAIRANFDIPNEECKTKEALVLINKNIISAMSEGDFVTALELSKMADISEEEIQITVKESILKLVSDGKIFSLYHKKEDPENYEDDDYTYEENERKNKNSNSVEELLATFPEFEKIMDDPKIHQEMQDLFVHFAKIGQIERFNMMKERYKIDQETIQLAFQQAVDWSSVNKFKSLLALNELSEKPIDPLLMKSSDIFGDFVSFENYQTIKEIAGGNITEECRMFGVKVGGNTGINQLEQGFAKFRGDILKPDFDPEILIKSKLARDYFKSFIRFDESEWGGGSSIEDTVDRYLECRNNGEYDVFPLNKEFKESDVLMVDTVDKEAKPVQYSEAFLNRFNTIHTDLALAKELYLSKFPITKVISNLNQHLVRVAQGLMQKRDSMQDGKGKEALSDRIVKLQGIYLRDLKNFEENFQFLSKLNDKEIDSTLRQAMFMMGYAKNPNQLEKDLAGINTNNPRLDDITWTMNFSDHIVNKEVMSQYFKDKVAKNEFRKLISTKSFEEELTRFRNQDKKGKLPVKFIPSKGILLEFSGHIADACWADKYAHTIPATFPNFTAVTMVQNPGTKHERLFGSSIIIETREAVKDGQGLLLIRGLNPIENTINQLSVEDFYKQFVDYIKSLGEKTGKRVAIVIDNHSGGSSTNRPLLFGYLKSLKLERVKVPYRETEFNGYDVTKHAYLVN
jgi:hypothetical protein